MELFNKLSDKIGIPSSHVGLISKRASEYERVFNCSSSQTSNVSATCYKVVFLHLAWDDVSKKNKDLDGGDYPITAKNFISISGAKKLIYQSTFNNVQSKLSDGGLKIASKTSVEEICVALGVPQLRIKSLDILRYYVDRIVGNDGSSDKQNLRDNISNNVKNMAAAVGVACGNENVAYDKGRLFELSQAKMKKEMNETYFDMKRFWDEKTGKENKGRSKSSSRTNDITSKVLKSAKENKILSEEDSKSKRKRKKDEIMGMNVDEEEKEYQEWKKRMLIEAGLL